MEIRKVIIYVTRDGVLHTSEKRARQHARRSTRAQAESARTLEKILKSVRTPPSSGQSALPDSEVAPSFTTGTHKERILAAINAGHKKTRDIKRVTGIKPNVLYADLAKLRTEKVITATNRLKTTRSKARARKGR
jgi:hypothetical protein